MVWFSSSASRRAPVLANTILQPGSKPGSFSIRGRMLNHMTATQAATTRLVPPALLLLHSSMIGHTTHFSSASTTRTRINKLVSPKEPASCVFKPGANMLGSSRTRVHAFVDCENVCDQVLRTALLVLRKNVQTSIPPPEVRRRLSKRAMGKVLEMIRRHDPAAIHEGPFPRLKNAADKGMKAGIKDVTSQAPLNSVFVLVTGDGDFVEGVRFLKTHGHFVVCVSMEGSASLKLQQEAHVSYLLRTPRRR